MQLLAIDPGSEESAYVSFDTATGLPVHWSKLSNGELLGVLDDTPGDQLAIEMVASYGMAVGATVFETCVWAGRFIERWLTGPLDYERAALAVRYTPIRVFRRDVKLHLCGSQRAKDANIRQALIDRYGPGKDKAVGLKASPGPLYGIKADCWQALAVAVTAAETVLTVEAAA